MAGVAGLRDRATGGLASARERSPLLDRAVRAVLHYNAVGGSRLAGSVTYFGFLSVFPLLALAFFVVGRIAVGYPAGRDDLRDAIEAVLPGLVGDEDGQLSLSSFDDAQGSLTLVALLGLVGVLYTGLGWLSALRESLEDTFEEPADERFGFVGGKVRDLLTLVTLGSVLMVSVVLAGFVNAFSRTVLELLGLDGRLDLLLSALTVVLGVGASTLLLFLMFRLLARPHLPRRALVEGALLGAVGFELLKQLNAVLLGTTKGQPAFQAFGVALLLLVWINYFSRLVVLAAAWAHVAEPAPSAAADGVPDPDPREA